MCTMRLWSGLALLAGCGSEPLPLDGSWLLDGDRVSGMLAVDRGGGCASGRATIGLWGEGYGTPGIVDATLVEEAPGEVWAWFPLRTGVGEGSGALRIEGAAARLPLGARPGEHDVHLMLEPGALRPDEIERLQGASRAQLDAAEADWNEGRFRLMDGTSLVGEVRFRGAEQSPLVAVYDETWLSAGLVEAARADDGADLLLAFPVEPSLGGEQALLRLNVPTGVVVVPTGEIPDAMDRRLRLVPGEVEEGSRAAQVAAARAAAEQAEEQQLSRLLPQLARLAQTADGRCLAPGDVDPAWPVLLAGYSARVLLEAGRCVVEIEASPVQHGRRFRGVADANGIQGMAEE